MAAPALSTPALTAPISPPAAVIEALRVRLATLPDEETEPEADAVAWEEVIALQFCAVSLRPATADAAVAMMEIAAEHLSAAADEWAQDQAVTVLRNVSAFMRAAGGVDPRPVMT